MAESLYAKQRHDRQNVYLFVMTAIAGRSRDSIVLTAVSGDRYAAPSSPKFEATAVGSGT